MILFNCDTLIRRKEHLTSLLVCSEINRVFLSEKDIVSLSW